MDDDDDCLASYLDHDGALELLQQEKCNVCSLMQCPEIVSERTSIPIGNLKVFIGKLKRYEMAYLKSKDGHILLLVNYEFKKMAKYCDESFINLKILKKHFDECIMDDILNCTLGNIRDINNHIRVGLTPDFMYKDEDDLEFNQDF